MAHIVKKEYFAIILFLFLILVFLPNPESNSGFLSKLSQFDFQAQPNTVGLSTTTECDFCDDICGSKDWDCSTGNCECFDLTLSKEPGTTNTIEPFDANTAEPSTTTEPSHS